MPLDEALSPPTSEATTKTTEPEVAAGIASAEGSPGAPTSFRAEDEPLPSLTPLLLFAGIALVGLGIGWYIARRT